MAKTDTIADFLTRLRNAASAGQTVFEADASKLLLALSKILAARGYLASVEVVREKPQLRLKISLARDEGGRVSFRALERVSRPSRRVYVPAREVPRVLNGLGIAILSTSKGLMTDAEARTAGLGGEILCRIY
jgi:small subunit ribosomal protein S8